MVNPGYPAGCGAPSDFGATPPAKDPRAPGARDLEDLHATIRACRLCVDQPRGGALGHEPRPVLRPSATARLLIAGQAPGLRVHLTGVPFNDRSGDRLRDWLGIGPEVFHDMAKVAILPMGFCFPGYDSKGGDRPPRVECAATWHARVLNRMPQVKTIIMIGFHAQKYHLSRCGRGGEIGKTLTETMSRWRAIAAGQGPRLFPLPHPSWRNTGWLKRHPWFETDLLPVLRAETRRTLADAG